MLEQLKREVYEANMALPRSGLVLFTWGNVSGIDRTRGLVVIKPSGVPYETLQPEQMVVTDLDGTVIEGKLRPSRPLVALLIRILFMRLLLRRQDWKFFHLVPRMVIILTELCRVHVP